ncbi:hypothetical protein [Spiroplasma endosymbiont of Apeira syringaria]|uniref:hypothetical protein n=1 Tax=Spiroplasma endosymbiont of Apeira syringaria TaxID=3066307 RepID=UPI0030D2AE0A
MQDIAVHFEKHFWIHSVSLFPPQVHVGRSPIINYKEILFFSITKVDTVSSLLISNTTVAEKLLVTDSLFLSINWSSAFCTSDIFNKLAYNCSALPFNNKQFKKPFCILSVIFILFKLKIVLSNILFSVFSIFGAK